MRQHLTVVGIALIFLQSFHASAGEERASPAEECRTPAGVSTAYKGVFYANDFGYLDDPCLKEHDPRDAVTKASDRLKLMDIAPHVRLSIGGEARLRYQNEDGIGLSRLSGLDDEFVLSRIRAYANVEITKYFRGFVEVIDARKSGGALPPRGIEVVRGDVLNGFGEFRAPVAGGKAYLRAGRQELLFGKQRLISPLDWGNTRRSFDGFRGGYQTKDFEVSAWFANPRVIADRSSLRNEKTDFSGVYATWRGLPGQTIDVYVLNLDQDPLLGADSNFWTIGSRLEGGAGVMRWEAELALQTGDVGADDMRASSITLGLGADFKDKLPWSPSVSFNYDRASGDNDPDDGKARTFNQLFPLAHAWLGIMDLVARQNIEAFSVKLSAKPHALLRTSLVLHDFALESRRGALFNAGGAVIRQDTAGLSGKDVGRELDLVVGFAPRRWFDLEVGYGRFWGGGFIARSGVGGISANADFLYLQTKFRF